VTSYVARKFGSIFFEKYLALKKGHYRCTIDCLDDYVLIQNVFSSIVDPVRISMFDLIEKLQKTQFQPVGALAVPRLIFGAAQLGSNYGITNKAGQPDRLMCQALIKTAISNGVAYLDTARAYGNSEIMIGQSLKNGWFGRVKVITKLSPLLDCPQNATKNVLNAFVDASIFESCRALNVQKIDVLMLHRASHLFDWNGGAWQRILELQASGVINKLGVSVQSPVELEKLFNISAISYIQLPFNILDWRWDEIVPKLITIKATRSLTIHVRSTLLQGLLTSSNENHWRTAHVEHSFAVRDWLKSQVIAFKRLNIVDLCLSYVNAMSWVDGIVTGMETMDQLIENINYLNLPLLTTEQIETIKKTRPKLSARSLNPSLWHR
jgi:spore coat polysaccharide biosynthesis protein SpsF